MASWSTQRCLQEAREACGGLGYSHYSRLGTMLQDQDVNQTWEGDNNVLLQQTAKFMVDIGRKRMKGTKVTTQTLEWLALEPVAGRTFPAKSRDDLFNIDILVGALEHRANARMQKSAMRIAPKIMGENKMHPVDAWNDTQVFYLHDLGKHYATVVAAHEFRYTVG